MKSDEILDFLLDQMAQKLRPLIIEIVSAAMPKPPQYEQKEEDTLWSSKDLTKFLSIGRTTAVMWEKKGLIKSYRIGHKKYFKSNEIKSLLKNPRLKHIK